MGSKNLAATSKLFGDFKTAFQAGEDAKCKSVLQQLKIRLTEFPSLPPIYEQGPTADQELLLARDIMEHAVMLSVRLKDEVAFERNFLQLKTYYTDTRHLLPPSKQEHLILGLNLLRLLVQNRIAEFHTELELTGREAQAHPCIAHDIELEQSLMEGSYTRILTSRRSLPHDSYAWFMDLLMTTVRDEIAGCSEKAYESLSVAHAKKILMFGSDAELRDYAHEHGWEVRDGCIFFHKAAEESISGEIPSMQLIQQTLGYARELERIV